MREIKFRAWQKDYRKMLPDEQLESYPMSLLKSRHNIFELMQYTGLKDKNGKEIYESDYLKTDEAGWVGKVMFSRGAFILLDDKGGFSVEPNWEQCEVIGNEYEME